MRCSKCNNEINDNSKFCPFCGNKVKADKLDKEVEDSSQLTTKVTDFMKKLNLSQWSLVFLILQFAFWIIAPFFKLKGVFWFYFIWIFISLVLAIIGRCQNKDKMSLILIIVDAIIIILEIIFLVIVLLLFANIMAAGFDFLMEFIKGCAQIG